MRALVVLLALTPALVPATAIAKGPILHKVRSTQETYAALADHYYGKRYLERHLRLFNRKSEPLAKGTTILIPTYRFIAAKPGQSLADFARTYLNDEGRAPYLAAIHGLKRGRIPRGKRLKVVQSLGHVVRPGESLKAIARTYYRETNPNRLRLLMLYNKLETARVRVGMTLRIPLDSKEFSHRRVAERAEEQFDLRGEVEAKVVSGPVGPPVIKGKRRIVRKERRERAAADLERIEANLETAERLYDDGEYTDCAKLTAEALATVGTAPKATRAELMRVSAFALVALGEYGEARARFVELLSVEPKYELDLYQTSPKILDVFQSVAER
ncbi:MAG: LysM peptidoglycan-binding domain-containing protein [Deltaproteobacteria bacterium]|jgi:hypothetical protein